jgi:hypothetical protein
MKNEIKESFTTMNLDELSEDGRFSVTHQNDVYNLTIINATVTDAGEYQCIEKNGVGQKSRASLNVNG